MGSPGQGSLEGGAEEEVLLTGVAEGTVEGLPGAMTEWGESRTCGVAPGAEGNLGAAQRRVWLVLVRSSLGLMGNRDRGGLGRDNFIAERCFKDYLFGTKRARESARSHPLVHFHG